MKMMYESRYHFSVARGLLLYDDRIDIPDVMKKEMLYKIHLGHQGVNK